MPHVECTTGLVYCLHSFRDGALRFAQWLEGAGYLRCSSAGWDNAAGGGHLHVLKVIFQQLRVPVPVARRNESGAVWLCHCTNTWQCPPPHAHVSPEILSARRTLFFLLRVTQTQWLLEHKAAEYKCSTNSYGLAASRGHLDVCKWLHETMPDLLCPVWAAETAAAAGHLEVSAPSHCPVILPTARSFESRAVCFPLSPSSPSVPPVLLR